MSLEAARAYAAEHLKSMDMHNSPAQMGMWSPGLRQKYGVVDHGGVHVENRGQSDIWFEIENDNARRLVDDSRTSAEAWDLARAIVFNNTMRGKPIPEALRDFNLSVMIDSWPRPRASESYNNAKRDTVLSKIIFEVWLLFDLSETKACDVVRLAAYDARVRAPASLKDIWRKSHFKRCGLPERTPEFRSYVWGEAAERLIEFQKLRSGETAP